MDTSIKNMFSLEGKVAVISGGKGKFGRQIVEGIAGSGAKTYIAARNVSELEELAKEMTDRGYQVFPLFLDLSKLETIDALRDEVMRREGRVDIFIHNAVARVMKSFEDVEGFAASMEVNATGMYAITRAFGDVMAQQGSGSIIEIGSMQGMIGPDPTLYVGTGMYSMIPDYFFHKGGMINFTRFIASYYGTKGVRCNCVSPGGFQTEATPEVFVNRYNDRTLLGRMAGETDLMGTIVFLASDASAYITGANIPVDGGYTAK